MNNTNSQETTSKPASPLSGTAGSTALISTYRDPRVGITTLAILIGLFTVSAWSFLPLNAQRTDCATGEALVHSFAAGSEWDLCWSADEIEGIRLHEMHFTTPDGIRRQVMKEASIGQIIMTPDDGSPSIHYLAESGLGGQQFLPLTNGDCPDGELLTVDGVSILCKQVMQRSYMYRYFTEQEQGELLQLFSISKVAALSTSESTEESIEESAEETTEASVASSQIYITAWQLYDDGVIRPMVGDAGSLAANQSSDSQTVDTDATLQGGYLTDVFWRLDIDIALNGDDDVVEQFDIADTDQNTEREISVSTILTETARVVDPTGKRSWRVRAGTLTNADGHLVSYQLEPRNVGHAYAGAEPWAQHQLTIAALNPCERLATQNVQAAQAPEGTECADDVSQFANGEALTGKDVVFWYRMSAHRPISNELYPAKPVAWQSFQLVPRDWSEANPFAQ